MTSRDDVRAELAANLLANLPALLAPILAKLRDSADVDAQRQARVDWFRMHAMLKNVTAARVLLGGTLNTASHEIPMYEAAIASVNAIYPGVIVEAAALGPYWDINDNASSDAMRAAVALEAFEAAVPATAPAPAKRRATPKRKR